MENQTRNEELTKKYNEGFNQKMISSYLLLSDSSMEPIDALVQILSLTNSFAWSLDTANSIMHRQGKNRKTYGDSYSKRLYMSYLDYDKTLAAELDDLFVNLLNDFLVSIETELAKPDLNTSTIKYLKDEVKTLMIMLFASNQLSVFPSLNLPTYVIDDVEKTFNNLEINRSNVFEKWTSYLYENNYPQIAKVVLRIGRDKFFEAKTTKSINIFYDYFGDYIGDMSSDQVKTLLKVYEYHRELYSNQTYNLLIKDICLYFNEKNSIFTKDIYDKHKNSVVSRMKLLTTGLSEDEGNGIINKLVFKNED